MLLFSTRFAPIVAFAGASLALLGGCNGPAPSDKQVLAEANKLPKPLPGLYRSTTKLTSFELPGTDPRTQAMMRDRFAQVMPQQREFCVTPASAARGFADLVRQTQQGDCRIDRFAADGGRLSARMSCRLAGDLSSTVAVEGTGQPARSHVDLTILQTGPSVAGGSQKIALQVDNVRIGDCP